MGVDIGAISPDGPEEPLTFGGNPVEDGQNLQALFLLVERVVMRQMAGAISADLEFMGRFCEMSFSIRRLGQ